MMKLYFSIVMMVSFHTQANICYITDLESENLLTKWIHVHLKLVRTTKGIAHIAYARHFAYTSIAFYESLIPGDKKQLSLSGQLNGLSKINNFNTNNPFVMEASANAAYAAMLKHFYSGNINSDLIDSLENVNTHWFVKKGLPDDLIRTSSDVGKSIARTILEWAAEDGSDNANAPYTPPSGEEYWKPTPPKYTSAAMPFWKNIRTMVIGNSGNKLISIPPPFSSQPNSEFHTMAKEVFDVSQQLTKEHKDIARFWDDSPNGKYLTVSGHWSSILAQAISIKKLSLLASAEAYAKMHMAIFDASIVAWHGKYTYNVVRPITFIRKNISMSWLPLIETPPHPEFPAAHATLSMAAATALTNAIGTTNFTDSTYADLGMQARSFNSFDDAAREAGLSRLYGGIHYRFSIEKGLEIGKRTAVIVIKELEFAK